MGLKDPAMANESQERRAPTMGWPIAIFVATAMLAGGFAGYNESAAEAGNSVMAPWIGPVIAISLGTLALVFYFRRHAGWWRYWSPRKRLYWTSLLLSGGLGMAIAIIMQSGDGVDGLFSYSALTPAFAITLSMLWIVGLAVALFFYHHSVDDHERQAYHLGGLAGFYAFIVPCPVWWVLARAELAPPVEAMPLFALSLTVNSAVYAWYKFR